MQPYYNVLTIHTDIEDIWLIIFLKIVVSNGKTQTTAVTYWLIRSVVDYPT